MNKVKDIIKILGDISDFSSQEKWDNSSLNIGSLNQPIKNIIISLDIDNDIVEKMEENTLLITHHPILMSLIKHINTDFYPNNLIKQIIKKDSSHIAMHTNFDKTHLNKYVFEDILGFKITKEKDFICYGDIDMSMNELYLYVKDKLNLTFKKISQSNNNIKKIAFTTGSGGSLIPSIDADCFLTGDIKYHDALMAYENNLSLIDIGHYESEIFFSEILYKELKKYDIKAIICHSKNPFKYV
jgi:dinuclear metal center YbgI/SA1388 family protein